jgi:hypothetical protein
MSTRLDAWLKMAGVLGMALLGGALAGRAGQDNIRVLFDFETDGDIPAISQGAANVTFDLSQDDGVTSGKRCCRMTFKKGGDYCEIYFNGDKKQGWADYDYFAMDVNNLGDDRTSLTLELWDALSKNYPTRCGLDFQVLPGKQTVLIPINRAKRNGKEGRSWDELEPKDKIDLKNLTKCKIQFTTPKDHDLVWRVDNIRLLKEDALGRKIDVKLPDGTKAFNFGAAPDMPGFPVVRATAAFDGARGFSSRGDLKECGKRWPDPLAGNGVYSPSGHPYTFETALPDGDYLVWLIAGPVIRTDIPNPKYLLKVGDKVLFEDQPDTAALYGEKYIFRFMKAIYSQRPNALWQDFIGKMYPVHQAAVKVTGGKLIVEACNFELCAMAVLPAAQKQAFDEMARAIEQERLRVFTASLPASQPKPLAKAAGDGDVVAFVPSDTATVLPQTGPTAAERLVKGYDLAAAAGQNLIFRVAITAFADGKTVTVTPPALSGPSAIPASATRVLFQNFRQRGIDAVECGLLPTDTVPLEPGVTRCFWMWMQVPKDAKPGTYSGNVALSAGPSKITFPMKLKIYPFALEDNLPYAFGMWYGMNKPADESQTRRVIKEQLAFMREIGFTGVEVPGPDANGRVDTFLIDLAREVGMGRNPLQMSMISSLGMGRSLARSRLGLGAQIDRRPGCEFDHAEFHDMFLDSAKKFGSFLKQCSLPLAVQSVDEPREVPNPWNRNLEQTDTYADWLHEAGVTNVFVTPMGDSGAGKDYTALVDHHDIISTHAGKGSAKLMSATPQKGKTLWLYNTGMDRLSWGFYNWRVGSTGRWEWHFCWADGGPDNGYINEEWYNPFTGLDGAAPRAPYATQRGGILFKSSFLTTADGITDAAYLVTLEKRLAQGNVKPEIARKAKALLDTIKKEIPFLPDVAGLEGADSGALVGGGIKAPAAAKCETWRREIGDLLTELQN